MASSKIRFIVLHYHLFKNAGTTFSAILERNFAGQLGYLHGASPDSSLANDDLLHYLETHPHIRAVSSHHLHPPSPEVKEFVFFDVMSVRHPLDRLRSMYDFYSRSAEGEDPLITLAQSHDLGGFFCFLLDRSPHLVNNVQVNYFANAGRYTRPPDDIDLRKALDLIRRAAVLIIADSFDTCAVAAEYFLQPAFGKLDFSYRAENVSPNRLAKLDDRLQAFRLSCGPELYDLLLKANELDCRLLELTDAELRRRVREVPDADERLQKFRDRCVRRQQSTGLSRPT